MQLAGAVAVVEVIAERFEINIGGVDMGEEFAARFGVAAAQRRSNWRDLEMIPVETFGDVIIVS